MRSLLVTGGLFFATFAVTGIVHLLNHALGFAVGFWFALALVLPAAGPLGWYRGKVIQQRGVRKVGAHVVAALAGLGLGALFILVVITTVESVAHPDPFAQGYAEAWAYEWRFQTYVEGALPWLAAVWALSAGAASVGIALGTFLTKTPAT